MLQTGVLILGLWGVSAAPVTVNLFSMCGDGESPDYQIKRKDTVLVNIFGSEWPVGMSECPVIFAAYDGIDDVIYEFQKFRVSHPETTLSLKSGFVAIFTDEVVYTANNTPSIGGTIKTNTYLRISAERTSMMDQSLSAVLKLYNEDHDDVDLNEVRETVNIVAYAVGGAVVALIIIGGLFVVFLLPRIKRKLNERRYPRPVPRQEGEASGHAETKTTGPSAGQSLNQPSQNTAPTTPYPEGQSGVHYSPDKASVQYAPG